MFDYWLTELWRFGLLATAGLLIGWLGDNVALGVLLGVSVYLARLIYSIYQLESWLRRRRSSEPPELGGVIEEISHLAYQIQKRGRSHKRRLTSLLSRFREATTAMPDATVVLMAQGEIEWFNAAASRLLSLHNADVGHRIDNLFRHPDFLAYLRNADFSQPLVLQSPVDAQVTLLIHIVPYGDNQRLLIARDITRLQKLEQVRRDFVANVSHELRTPLTVVAGFLETMEDDADPQWARSLELMRAQTARMQLIVEQLLLLSRLETESGLQRREHVAVPAMLAAIREEAHLLGEEKKLEVTLDCDNTLWLDGNSEELRSALSNLAFNAVQYTLTGGKIHMHWYRDPQGAHFSVTDTGIGIPSHHIPRLTERFYRVDAGRSREVGGTGLGLAIVKHVLQRHGAALRIESMVEQGSTFTCDFPTSLIVPPNSHHP